MPNPITTTGLKNGPVSTTRNPGETTPQWETRHAVEVGKGTPSGSKLTTTWTSQHGPQEVVTTRGPGETPEDFLAEHILDMSETMQDEPPIP